jgi:hypothetical protein
MKRVRLKMERVRLKPRATRPVGAADSSVGQSLAFGPAPLIEGERAADYNELLAAVSATLRPADVFERIWEREFVDREWEVLRLRRLKAALIDASTYRGLEIVLAPLLDAGINELVEKWARREPDAIREVDRVLASANLTMDAVIAQTLGVQLAVIEGIDRMITIAEVRRDGVLHEIERHRASFALVIRRTVNQLEHREKRALEANQEAKDAA